MESIPSVIRRTHSPSVDACRVGTDHVPSRIRILKFLALFGFGGTERQVVNLVRNLDRSRFEPSFACLKRWGHFLDDIEQQRIPIAEYRIRKLYKPSTFQQQLRFTRDIRREQIQIVHSYNFYANVFAVPAARFAGVPVVIASIRDTGMGITPAKMRLHRLACRLADCVLVNAEAIREWLIGQGYRAEKIVVIRNGIDLSRFAHPSGTSGLRHELGLPTHAPLVVVLARLVPQKGIETFLEAAAEVSRCHPEARFLIVGDVFASSDSNGVIVSDDSYKKSLQRHVDRLGLDGRVIFTGFRPDVPELLSQAAVSVLPSISGEGLPNALLESMAAGVPSIATRVGGSPEVIDEDGVTGLLVPPRDPRALAQAMCSVLENPELARRLGAQARDRITRHFSTERLARETENLYATLLARATRGNGNDYRGSRP